MNDNIFQFYDFKCLKSFNGIRKDKEINNKIIYKLKSYEETKIRIIFKV